MMPSMRRAPSIAALLTALTACVGIGILLATELRSSIPATSPRAAIEAASAERAQRRADRFAATDRSWDVAFADGMVRDRARWSAPGSPPTLDLAIVNATPGADLAQTARACVSAQPRDTRVQCYVFAATEAYEFKDITGELQLAEPTAIVNLCWAVMASTKRPGGPVHIADMRDAAATWSAQQCPDSWTGTGVAAA
jgi:hypothetical protein